MTSPASPPPPGPGPRQPSGSPTTAAEGIVTPEAVRLEFAEAGLGSRSLAFALDLLIRAAALFVVLVSLSLSGLVLDGTVVVVVSIASVFATVLVYPAAFETLWNGRTPGKAALGLRVVTIEGAPVRFRHAAIRSALGIVDFLASGGTVAVLAALLSRHGQRLGDVAAGTIVIRERQASRQQRPVEFRPPPGWEGYVDAIDVTGLRTEVAVLIRSFLLRVHELTPDARRDVGAGLARRVAADLRLPLPEGTDTEAFLVAIASAHQQRHR